MSAFSDDLAEKMKNPEFAYEYGRTERELEIVKAVMKRYPTHIVEVIDRGMGETYKSHDNCPQCVAIALITEENK